MIDKATIMALKTDYEQTQSRFRVQAEVDDNFIEATTEWLSDLLKLYIDGFPEGFRLKALPLAWLYVENAKDSVMAGEIPEVTASLQLEDDADPSDELERRRKVTEQFYRAFLTEVATRTTNNPFSELLRKQYGPGMGVLSFPWDEAVWQNREKLQDIFPWRVETIDPRNIWPDPHHDPPRDYIIEDDLPNTVAKERYPDLNLPEVGRVKRLIYCSEFEYAVYIDDEPVLGGEDGVVDNPLGMLWYEMALSGLGQQRADRDPVTLWKGLVRGVRGIISMITTNYNIVEANKFQESFGTIQVEAETVDEAQEVWDKLTIGPQEGVPTRLGVRIHRIFQESIGQGTIWEQQELTRWAEILMGGQLQSGNYREQTASGLAQRVSLQQGPYQSAKVSNEQAIANMLRKVTRYYKTHIAEAFSLRLSQGKRIRFKPDDLLDDLHIEVNLRPVTPADRKITADQDLREYTAGIISLPEYRRRQHILNGKQMDEERAEHDLKFHPKVMDAAATIIAQSLMPPPQPEQPMQQPGQAMPQPMLPQPAASPAEQPFQEVGVNGNRADFMNVASPTR